MQVNAPISLGELMDKLSILKVKLNKIPDSDKRKSVQLEYKLLLGIAAKPLREIKGLREKLAQLEAINEDLWGVLGHQRAKEFQNKFDKEFVSLSRAVYFKNDERFKIKDDINRLTASLIKEQKHYE
tara:strand:- start:297 stop:677 length:381 start_codon:yes stop_codon:yes gene_type:complete